MKSVWPVNLLLFILFASFCQLLHAEKTLAGELHSRLEANLDTLSDDAQVSVIIHLKEKADISAIDRELKKEHATLAVRHERVITALRETAARTQSDLIHYLAEAKREGWVTGFTPYWISNMIIAQATKDEIYRLMNHPDVDIIELNFRYELIKPVTPGSGGTGQRGYGVTEGLYAIHADRVWRELGITGDGVIVANLDTGVDGAHPALASRWRGTEPGVDPSEAWLDLVYGGTTFPVDHYGHGTHVMGTITGLGAATGDTIGVAWRAQWIACNAIDQGVGPEFDNDVIAAFEWLADPDGNPGTHDDVPDVVQNSWRINEYFGGSPPYTDCDDRWWDVIDNCEAAGVVVTWSAGNEGPGSETIGSPPDRIASPFNVYSVGAVDATNYGYPYPIASWSSRGPSGCDHATIKPEVCAPGVDVYSSVPGGGYQKIGWSGTSMAGPHVAGVVALMREANPNLGVDEIKWVIMETAHDFGTTGEDNTYGMGFIDAYEAVLMVMSGVGYLTGTVTDAVSGDPIPADMEILGTSKTTKADPLTGEYTFVIQGDSTYTVQASYFGYETMQQEVYVAPDDTTTLDFQLTMSPYGNFAGMVMDANNGLPIAGASVEIMDTPLDPARTGSRGVYNFGPVPSGTTYTVQTSAPGYGSNSEKKTIYEAELNLLALPLETGFSDNMENGINGWTHYIVTSGYRDQWHQSTRRNHTSGGDTSWKCGSTGTGNYDDYLDAGLESPTIDLQENSTLIFWHWMDAEIYNSNQAWDGGIVEISINGGPFNQITPVGGYPYTIYPNDASPFDPGTPCFSGSHDWRQEEFDLSGYSGNAKIRFRFGSDGYTTEEGWYVDDVVVAQDTETRAVSIMFLPQSGNIVFGPSGGTFTYSMALVNNTKTTQIFDWWIDVTRPNGLIYGPIATHTDTLSAGETYMETGLTQNVPDWVPAGTFTYNGKLGQLPDTVESISSFQFTKTGAAGPVGGGIEDWRLERNQE